MKIPPQIEKFQSDLSDLVKELNGRIDRYNYLETKRKEINEISKEYLKIQPLDHSDVRELLCIGIDQELKNLNGIIREALIGIRDFKCEFFSVNFEDEPND